MVSKVWNRHFHVCIIIYNKATLSWFYGWWIFLMPFYCSRSVEFFFHRIPLWIISSRSVERKIWKTYFWGLQLLSKNMCKIWPSSTKMAISQLIMVRFLIRKMSCNLQVSRILNSKHKCNFYYSIGRKIGTSVAPPSMKSTEHGLTYT